MPSVLVRYFWVGFTARPRPILVGSFTRYSTRSAAGTSCGAWAMMRDNNGAPRIDKVALTDVEEHGIGRLLEELASDASEISGVMEVGDWG